MKKNLHIGTWLLFIGAMILDVALLSCSNSGKKGIVDVTQNLEERKDTLHAVTLYGPTSYFQYRGQEMGFEYENLKQFAEDEKMVLDLKVASSLTNMLEMVKNGEADLIAYPLPKIEEYSDIVKYCGNKEITTQVLVQPKSDHQAKDVTELVGKTIYVEKDSKYHYRLENLNDELGGGITILPVSKDTLITEDLIAMVDNGEIPLTVVDSDIAELNKSYFPHLDISLKLSLDQYSSWAVRKNCEELAEKIDNWGKSKESTEMMKTIYKKYFEDSKQSLFYDDAENMYGLKLKKGDRLSPYDNLFKLHSSVAGYDWRLLAAIGYNESRFNPNIVSWAGARGIMQLMPKTANAMGIRDINNPDDNILAAARLLKKLDESLESRVADKEERMKFVVAAYNSGLGHIYDAIALAKKNGLNPEVWTGNVSEAALMKSRPQYYNDPVVKNGYFRGRETVDFVDRVMSVYSYYKGIAGA